MIQKLTCKSNKLLFYCTLNIWISDYSSCKTLPGSSLTALHLKCMMWLIWAQRERWLLAHQLRWWPLGYLVLIIITINCPPSALWSSHTAAQSQVLKITSSQFTFFIKNWNVSNIWEFPQLQPQLNSQQEEVFLENNGISCVTLVLLPNSPQCRGCRRRS